jgi:hypothetical protein
MTPEQKVAFVNGQIVCAQLELAAMIAENMQRQSLGGSMVYGEGAFMTVMDKYCISHNAITTFFNDV